MDYEFTRNLISVVQELGTGGAIFYTCLDEENELSKFVAT